MSFCNLSTQDDRQGWLSRLSFTDSIPFLYQIATQPVFFMDVNLTSIQVRLGGASGKEPGCQGRRLKDQSGSGRSPVGGYGNPLRYSRLKALKDRGAWRVTVHGSHRVGHD